MKKNEICSITSNIIIFSILLLFFIVVFIPSREGLSLLHGQDLLTPLATKMSIDRRHAREDYLQTLGPDIKYAAYYSKYY